MGLLVVTTPAVAESEGMMESNRNDEQIIAQTIQRAADRLFCKAFVEGAATQVLESIDGGKYGITLESDFDSNGRQWVVRLTATILLKHRAY